MLLARGIPPELIRSNRLSLVGSWLSRGDGSLIKDMSGSGNTLAIIDSTYTKGYPHPLSTKLGNVIPDGDYPFFAQESY